MWRFGTLAVLVSIGLMTRAHTEPDPVVEKALEAYCETNRIERAKIEAYELGLIPGTQTFRYQLPPVPHETPYKALSARYAFLFVDAKSGKVIEVKATRHNFTIRESTKELFAAMTEAGVKIRTDAEATKVMRTLVYLDIAAQSVDFKRKETDRIESTGRYRQQPNTFGGGVYCWSAGDDVGLRVDKDGFVTDLLGGHVR